MGDANFVNKGIDFIKQAVTADKADQKEQALTLYKKGLDYLMTGLKYEKNERAKAAIEGKVVEYLTRAEQLKEEISNPAPKKKVVSGGGKASDEDDDKDDDPEASKLKAALSHAIVSEKPNVKWEDVAGLEGAKGLLKEAVLLPIKFPQLFVGKRRPWSGILLYGPPGTGKSYLAKAVATEASSVFFSVSSSDLVSKFLGESERLVRNLFELARHQKPSIVFIDEIDSLAGNRTDGENDSSRRIKTEFLVQMQGVGKDMTGVLVLGATNTPWDLDPAIRRRFEKRVYIPLPDSAARAAMFKVHIGSTPHNLKDADFNELAGLTDGLSGSDISNVVRDALMEPIRTLQTATHFKKIRDPSGKSPHLFVPCSPSDPQAEELTLMEIPSEQLHSLDMTMDDFRRVAYNAKATVSSKDIERYTQWTTEFGQEG